MATVERSSHVLWEGSLGEGGGSFSTATNGAMEGYPVTFASRVQSPDGKTSPEEMIAASHATCYAMALQHPLAEGRLATAPDGGRRVLFRR